MWQTTDHGLFQTVTISCNSPDPTDKTGFVYISPIYKLNFVHFTSLSNIASCECCSAMLRNGIDYACTSDCYIHTGYAC